MEKNNIVIFDLNDLEDIKLNILEEKVDYVYFECVFLIEENKLLIIDDLKGTMMVEF